MSAHDRHLAGYVSVPVHVTCKCGHEYDATQVEEYGTGWLDPEDCSKCGASGEDLTVDVLDTLDIEERRLEARGIDF